MKHLFLLLPVVTLILSIAAEARTPADAAIEAAQAAKSDSLATKVVLLLHLINDEGYIDESNPDPVLHNFAKFHTTPKSKAELLTANYKRNSSGTYDLDSNRTPEEMLSQRIGGSCGTVARTFAYLLQELGVPSQDMRIVSAVCAEEYANLCPLGKGTQFNKTYRGGAPGHVFVLLRDGSQWRLINTTYSPLAETHGPHASDIKAVRDKLRQKYTDVKIAEKAWAKALTIVRKLTFDDIESVVFDSPTTLEQKLAAGTVVKVPIFASLPETLPGANGPIHFRQMLIYESVIPPQFTQHSWKDRFPIIASGVKSDNTCRFSYNGTE